MRKLGSMQTFAILVSHIDRGLGARPSRLGFKFRNDKRFERLCDESWRLYHQINEEDAPGKIVSGSSRQALQVINRFEERYFQRIHHAQAARSERIWNEFFSETVGSEKAYSESKPAEDDEADFEEFDESCHQPVAVLNDLIDVCWDVSSFDKSEFPKSYQRLLLAEGATRYIEKRLGLDIDTAATKFRELDTFHVDARLHTADGTDWRRVDRYLQQAITAYFLGLDLCAIALMRPLAEHIIRTIYAPALRPEIDAEMRLHDLIRKIQEAEEASWIKTANGDHLVDSASKVLHYKHFDDLKTQSSTSVLARELLSFVRNLLLRVPP